MAPEERIDEAHERASQAAQRVEELAERLEQLRSGAPATADTLDASAMSADRAAEHESPRLVPLVRARALDSVAVAAVRVSVAELRTVPVMLAAPVQTLPGPRAFRGPSAEPKYDGYLH